MSRSRAFSLLEVTLTMGLFGVLSFLTFLIFRNSSKIFATTSGRDRATAQLLKAGQALRRDLEMIRTDASALLIGPVPASLGGGADSDAILFLSAVDPTNQQVQTKPDGSPFWMRNILYYGVIPLDYTKGIDQTMTGSNLSGYEMSCPTKQLVRLEVDQNPGNNPNDPTSEDMLVSNFVPLLTRPSAGSSTATRKTVASNLLSFRCRQFGPELRIDLRAVSVEEARKDRGFGSTILYDQGRYTLQHTFSVFGRN